MKSENVSTGAPTIEVLLATFNGERFLHQQIESILSQTYEWVTILARDDGSTDGTELILRDFEIKHPERFRVLRDGFRTSHPKLNFERLMLGSTARYAAFSDQDDVWLPEKLALEMQAMQAAERSFGTSTPLLIFTDLRVVDERLGTISSSLWQHLSIPGNRVDRFERLLAQNIFTGCTGLMNRPLLERSLPIPEQTYMHDWWVALVAAAFGRLISLPVQTVLYRQHAHNAVGISGVTTKMDREAASAEGMKPTNLPGRIIAKFRQHGLRRKLWEMSENNALGLKERFAGELPADKLRLVEAYIRVGSHPNRWVRVFTWLRYGFFRESNRLNMSLLWYLWDLNAADDASRR
jgi:glycosyltransferase involved in cell wall biosynthesis